MSDNLPDDRSNNYGEWIAAVDRTMKRDWYVDTAEAGLGEGELRRFWSEGDAPEAFVAWFAEKYDLIRFEPLSHFPDPPSP
jgi:hypothetical protein